MREFIDAVTEGLIARTERYLKTDVRYLIRAGFWNNLNAFVIAGLSFLLYVAYARFLSKETYGTYQYLLSFFSIATAFTLTGMNGAVARAVAQGYEGTLRASIRPQLLYGLIPFIGALCGALYYFYTGNVLLGWGLVVIGVGTPLLYAYNTYGAFFTGRKDFRLMTIYGLVYYVLYYGALILAAFFSSSPLLILGVNLGSQVILAFVLYRAVLAREKPNDAVDPSALTYGMHLTAANVIGSVSGQVGSIAAFHFLGPAALALFSFASAFPDRIANISFKFLGAATLGRFANRSTEEVRSQLLRKMGIAAGAGALLTLGYIPLAPLFFRLFFPAYISAVPYSIFFSFSMILGAVYYLPATALLAHKRMRSLYALNIASSVLQIVLPVGGMLLFSLWGLIGGQMLGLLFSVVCATALFYLRDD